MVAMAYLRYWRPFLPSLVSMAPRRPTRVILAMSRLATGEVEKACVRCTEEVLAQGGAVTCLFWPTDGGQE